MPEAAEQELTNQDDLAELLEDKAVFGVFVDDEFDAQSYATTVISSHMISESLAKLDSGIELLNKELMLQVSAHHEDLLGQATGIEVLEGILQSIQSKILAMVKSIDRLKTQVSEPYSRIASRTQQLRRLQSTCDYLRRVLRIIQLNKRLQSQLKFGPKEITKAAQSLNELDYVLEGSDLTGIEIIVGDLKQIKESRLTVELIAVQMLEQGLSTQNQTAIGTALQVFHNLGSLQKQVHKFLEETNKKTNENISETLNPQTTTNVSRSANQPLVNSSASRGAFWEGFEKLMLKLQDCCQKVHILEKVLSKKRDPVSHTCFIEFFTETDGYSSIFNDYWNTICCGLRANLDKASQASSTLLETFECEYPKLLHLYKEFWINIEVYFNSKASASTLFRSNVNTGFPTSARAFEALKSSLHPFENAYLSRSLSRLFDPINLVFPSGSTSLPSNEESQSIIKALASELNVAAVDEHLMGLVAKNVLKTVQLYVAKCEQVLVTGAESGQLSGGLTNSQIRNASIANSLNLFHEGINEILLNLAYPPQDVVGTLNESLHQIHSFMDVALSLLLRPIMSSLENKIMKIHSENFAISTKSYHETAKVESCSRYILEIQNFIQRLRSDYFLMYTCQEFFIQRLENIASRLLELFVRHASLLRDLSEGGKLKLAADMVQLEFTLAPLCRRFEDLGQSYKLFRLFRPLLFQAAEDIPSNPSIGDTLPLSAVLHFLFSSAPPQLLSPHTVAGWSVGEYSEWLDSHPDENERIALISGTITAYAQKMDGQELHPVYEIIKRLIEKHVSS